MTARSRSPRTVEHAVLATGQQVDITAAAPDDFDAVRRFYGRLGDASTYYRFFGLRRGIPDDELRRAVAGHPEHLTLLAAVDGRLIGIGEYIVGADPTEAEVAFAVADDHHREGVATLLLERLARTAHERGLLTFTATVLPGNADMQLVFRTVGLPVHSRFDDGAITVVLDLASLTSLQAAARARRMASHLIDRAAPGRGVPATPVDPMPVARTLSSGPPSTGGG